MYKYEMTSTFIIVDQTDTLLLVLVVLDGERRQRNKNVIVRSPLPSADDVRPVPVQGKEEKTGTVLNSAGPWRCISSDSSSSNLECANGDNTLITLHFSQHTSMMKNDAFVLFVPCCYPRILKDPPPHPDPPPPSLRPFPSTTFISIGYGPVVTKLDYGLTVSPFTSSAATLDAAEGRSDHQRQKDNSVTWIWSQCRALNCRVGRTCFANVICG